MAKSVARPIKRRGHRRRLLVEHLGDRRVLAAITGAIFEDLNHSFQRDSGDVDAPHRLVYIDANQNAKIDAGERYALADAKGDFEFDALGDGTYHLRLFNGTETQFQTHPVEATLEGPTLDITSATQLALNAETPIALTNDSLVFGDFSTGTFNEYAVGDLLTKLQLLPSGDVLVIGTEANGETAWQFDTSTGTSTPVNLAQTTPPTSWADIAIDASGRGILLEPAISPNHGEGVLGIRELNATDEDALSVSEVLHTIPGDANVLTSNGHRSVFAWSDTGGTQLSLWSNTTASFISSSSIVSSITTDILAFDDASGILAVRTANGGVGVYDADANFAPLHTLPEITGPVAIDGVRDLLFTLSPTDAVLKLVNLRDGSLIADMAIDLSAIGQVSGLAIGDSKDSITVLGAAGITEIALRRADAHQVTITNNTDTDGVLFGIGLEGSNTAPNYDPSAPIFTTKEDLGFMRPAPATLEFSSDAEEDEYVILQRGPAGNGNAFLSVNGKITYSPNPDFNGVDSVNVSLHDGRDISGITAVTIIVDAVSDPPTDIRSDIDDIAENLDPDQVIGIIEVIDADGIGGLPHTIAVDDPRFVVNNGEFIFVGGNLDFETEPAISINVTATDLETNTTIERTVSVNVLDSNDPIESISPATAEVAENSAGALICLIQVTDPDIGDSHTLSVDDSRFRISGNQLFLAEGVALDHEQASSITVNITAVDSGNASLTSPIQITVLDVEEQPTTIELSSMSVMEWVRGANVGSVTVDGKAASNRFSVSVSDPRFEIAGSHLKLMDSEMLDKHDQDQVLVTVSVSDNNAEFQSISRNFTIDVLANGAPNHNPDNPFDVDDNGEGTTHDALLILNYINTHGPGSVTPDIAELYYDVNGDGLVTALDVLLLINEINRKTTIGTVNDGASAEGEGKTEKGASAGETPLPEEDAGNEPLTELGQSPLVPDTNPTPHPVGESTVDSPARPDDDTDEGSSQSYAEHVDATLRLLSEDDI